jgi:predicted dehydrogenase
VLVATPVTTHFDLVRQALVAGRHVFVEKPLASSPADALELALLADDRDLTLMVGHTFLFSPRVECIASHLAAGQAGRIHYVTSNRLNLGLHRSDVNVIWDLAPHDFSIIFHLLGEFPVSAQTVAQSVVRTDCPDVAFINLTFPSGTIASVAVSWLAPRKVRSTVLVGENQMIVYDDTFAEEPVKIYDKGVVRPETASFGANQLTYRYGDTVAPYVPADEPLAREIAYFLRAVKGGAPVALSDGWFGFLVVTALEAADRSWRDGGVPVAVDRHTSLAPETIHGRPGARALQADATRSAFVSELQRY